MAAKWKIVYGTHEAPVGLLELRCSDRFTSSGFVWETLSPGRGHGKQGTAPTLESAKTAAENAAREIAREILRELGDANEKETDR